MRHCPEELKKAVISKLIESGLSLRAVCAKRRYSPLWRTSKTIHCLLLCNFLCNFWFNFVE